MLQTDRKSTKQSQKRFAFSSLLHRTPLVAGGLVCAAVLVGFLFYIQTGLFVEQPSTVVSHTQTSADTPATGNSSSEQPKKSVLDSQDSIEAPAPPPTLVPSESKEQGTAATCHQAAATAAKQRYERALSAENDFHQQSLQKISGISKIFGSLGLAKDQTKAENTRHEKVVTSITDKYQQALDAAHCKK